MAAFQPRHLVPGHGSATDLSHARRDSYEYLLNHESLAGRNAQQVFTEMEWE